MAESAREDLVGSLLPASFRGVPFYVESILVAGGRKVTERPILNSDAQVVDDIGMRQRSYTVRGYIAERAAPDATQETGVRVVTTYADQRRAIIDALEAKDPGTLVHPIEGTITGLVAREFLVDESVSEVGIGRLTITLSRETERATPIVEVGMVEEIGQRAQAIEDTFLARFADRWHIDTAVVGAYEDGLTKAQSVFETMQDLANEAEQVASAVNAFSSMVSEGTAAAARLILSPLDLVASLRNAFATLDSIFPTASAAFDGLVEGFTFGDLDFAIDLTVPSAALRKANSDVMNVTIKALYLGAAYEAATGIEFLTVDEIDRVDGILSDQHEAILALGTADADSIASLEEMRSSFSEFLRAARLTARRITTDSISIATPRTLAFALYEDDALTPVLAALNDVYSYETVSGSVQVLSS